MTSKNLSETIEDSRYLEWDSTFFGFGVATIRANHAPEEQVAKEIIRFQELGCRLIYVRSPHPLLLSRFHAFLADKKRSYLLPHPEKLELKENTHPLVSVTENPANLYDLAYQAGEYSRYNLDPDISEADFKRLYRLWIDNSVARKFADYVLAATAANGKQPAGLITAKEKEGVLSIGLFATDTAFRGRGIGSQLIQEIIRIAARNRLMVEVTTQADNKTACHFYEHKGFRTDYEEFIYHVWDHRGNSNTMNE